jgi:hypothetical protein
VDINNISQLRVNLSYLCDYAYKQGEPSALPASTKKGVIPASTGLRCSQHTDWLSLRQVSVRIGWRRDSTSTPFVATYPASGAINMSGLLLGLPPTSILSLVDPAGTEHTGSDLEIKETVTPPSTTNTAGAPVPAAAAESTWLLKKARLVGISDSVEALPGSGTRFARAKTLQYAYVPDWSNAKGNRLHNGGEWYL